MEADTEVGNALLSDAQTSQVIEQASSAEGRAAPGWA